MHITPCGVDLKIVTPPVFGAILGLAWIQLGKQKHWYTQFIYVVYCFRTYVKKVLVGAFKYHFLRYLRTIYGYVLES